jgi:hypothetical protein
MIGNTKYLNGVADVLKKGKKGNVSKLVGMSGLGLRLQCDGVMKDARFRKSIHLGDEMGLSGGKCWGCGMMNDKFLFVRNQRHKELWLNKNH